ncbi:MAG: O-antigen ligase family protein, partial [Nitrosomonas sp.]|nr:O-antigen ligase family protein [Nitrosomonas sp.]
MQISIVWRELFIKFSLVFICLGLWRNGVAPFAFSLLAVAWLLDGGLYKLRQTIKEPLVQAILMLCALLFLGLLWGDVPEDGKNKWVNYFILLIYIPLSSLLNKDRLPWVVGALLVGYLCVLAMGVYQWLVMGGQGVPQMRMSYLSFSSMLGIGIILLVYISGTCRSVRLGTFFWVVALVLLFIQFHQYGRAFLLATLLSVSLLMFLHYKSELRKFLGVSLSLLLISSFFAYNSAVFQDRWSQAKADIVLSQQGNYSSSLGYRLAIWDVGLHGIAERPLFGHGTGTPESYFDETVKTYKEGIYKDLPKFQRTYEYHSDWFEIGMHIGVMGILAFAFLLWRWYQVFKICHVPVLGAALVSYIFFSGLTATFMLQNRI